MNKIKCNLTLLLLPLLFLFSVFCYGFPAGTVVLEYSSELTDFQGAYYARNLTDSSWRSWAEGAQGNGIGEYFTLVVNDYSGRVDAVYGFAFKNGYGNPEYYSKNNRVKAFKIYVDGQYTETIRIEDTMGFEQYAFKNQIDVDSKIRFVIDDVYPGTDYDDTCVAEIMLLAQIVSRREFYDRMNWVSDDFPYKVSSVASIADTEEFLVIRYTPWDLPEKWGNVEISTKVALLDEQSSLKLNDNLPRIDGATAMYPLYSAFVRAVYPEAELEKNEDWYIDNLMKWKYFPSFEFIFERTRYSEWGGVSREDFFSIVQCNTTPKAYQNLIDGKADIIFCYEPSEAEKRAAAEKGITLKLTPIAKDAFVFIVNEKNSITNITQQQVRDIYSGRVTNWKTISGIDEPIIAYQRPENSGSQTILQSIMKGETLISPIHDGELVSERMYDHYISVVSDFYNYNSAIGYSFRFYINEMIGGAGVKMLPVDRVVPNLQNIKSGTYPFSQTVYAVTTENESENTQKLIDWILSDQGQALVEKTGYVPL